jgi:hypothetical protein
MSVRMAGKSEDFTPSQHAALDEIERLMKAHFDHAMVVIADPINEVPRTTMRVHGRLTVLLWAANAHLTNIQDPEILKRMYEEN